jgi:hypothetical protein
VLAKGWDSDLRIHHMFFRFPPLLLATYDLRLENNAMLYAGYPRALRLTPCGILRGCPERSLLFYEGLPQATCPPKRVRAGGSDPQVKRSSSHAEGVTILERSDRNVGEELVGKTYANSGLRNEPPKN